MFGYKVKGVGGIVGGMVEDSVKNKGQRETPLWKQLVALCQEYGIQPKDNPDGSPDIMGTARIPEWDRLLETDPQVKQQYMAELTKQQMRQQGIDPNSPQGKARLAVMSGGAMPQELVQEEIKRQQAAQQQLASGQGGDPDPVVFPGQKLAKLSDYVGLMKGMQTGDMQGALKRYGLDMTSYGQAAAQWGNRLAADPVLNAKFSAMMQQR
jgi:hypothetical protein